MADTDGIRSFFGENFLYQHGVELVGEKLHIGFNILYVLFLVAFGISYTVNIPSCYPVNSTEICEFSEVKATFVSNLCISEAAWYFTPNNIRVMMILLFFYLEVAPSLCFIDTDVSSTIAWFAKLEKEFNSLELDAIDDFSIAMEPDLEQDPKSPYKKLRSIAQRLWTYNTKSTMKRLLLREIYLVVFLFVFLLTVIGVFVLGFFQGHETPIYFCDVNIDQYSGSNSTRFICNFPFKDRDWTIMYFYILVILSHFLVRAGILHKRIEQRHKANAKCSDKMSTGTERSVVKSNTYAKSQGDVESQAKSAGTNQTSDKALEKLSKDARETRNCMLFLATIWCTSQTGFPELFSEFVTNVFSPKWFHRLDEDVKIIGTQTDPNFTKFVRKILKEDLICKNKKPNMKDIIHHKYWGWLVELLNKHIELIDQPDLDKLEKIDTIARDARGHSILYYALKRGRNNETFHHVAAKLILMRTPKDKRIVLNKNSRIHAEEFVLDQSRSDSTYPDVLRDYLVKLIRNEKVGWEEAIKLTVAIGLFKASVTDKINTSL